jgi:hypothetical protein
MARFPVGELGMKCPSCGYENSDDARYCGLCERPFGSSVNEPSAAYGLPPLAQPGSGRVPAAQAVLRSQPKGLNWFQRHLNWTWFFAQLAVGLISYIIMTVFVTSLIASGPGFLSEASFFASFSVIYIVVLILQLLAEFGVGAWVLIRKDRSLGWLLIFVVPMVGWIIFLCLENRNLIDEMPAPPAHSAPSGSPRPASSIPPGLAPPGLGYRSDKYGP